MMTQTPHLSPIPNAGVFEIRPYIGGDVTPSGFSRRVVLASNENPYGTSPHVRQTIQEHLSNLHSYPSGEASALKDYVARFYDLAPNRIVFGNGSEEILCLVGSTFAGPGDEIIYPAHGFLVYRNIACAVGATPVAVPQPQLRLDLERVRQAVTSRTKIIYMDNPANPLGTYITKQDLCYFLDDLPPHVIVVMDGAYAEFATQEDYPHGFDWAHDRSNVVITRTFSKAFGLAGLRLGWGYMPTIMADYLNRIRMPFNVNRLAQVAGIAALEDMAWTCQTTQATVDERQRMYDVFLAMSLRPRLSATNFLLIEPKNPDDLYQYLGRQGILLRPVKAYDLPQFLRASIGTPHENNELAICLKAYLSI